MKTQARLISVLQMKNTFLNNWPRSHTVCKPIHLVSSAYFLYTSFSAISGNNNLMYIIVVQLHQHSWSRVPLMDEPTQLQNTGQVLTTLVIQSSICGTYLTIRALTSLDTVLFAVSITEIKAWYLAWWTTLFVNLTQKARHICQKKIARVSEEIS